MSDNQSLLLLQDYVDSLSQVISRVESFNFLYLDSCTSAPSHYSAQHRLYNLISCLVHEDLLNEQAKDSLRGSVLCPSPTILFFSFTPKRFTTISRLLRNIHYDAAALVVLDSKNLTSYLVSPKLSERECARILYTWLYEN